MADTIAKTPKTAEPQADYTIQVEAPARVKTTTTTTTTSGAKAIPLKGKVAEVVRTDEDGHKFDKHGVRIGRWEMEPCGDDCMPNVTVSCLMPCVSAAQIAHRMGGSYVWMLALWGVLYSMSVLAGTMSLPSSSIDVEYKSIAGHTTVYDVDEADEDLGSKIVWQMVSVVVGLIWLLANLLLRGGVRERFDLPGSCICDCCCVLWCPWCSLMQLATHVKSYTPGSCSLLPSVEPLDRLPGYDDGETK